MNILQKTFSELKGFNLVNKEWQFLDFVYVTNNSIYGLKVFETVDCLENEWESCQMEFATRVQARLEGNFDGFRWDMYLIFFVNEEVSSLKRKYVENNRMYFRKIVISNSEIIEERLPFNLTYDESLSPFIYGNNHFLMKLEEQLTDQEIEKIGEGFLKVESTVSEEEIYNLIVGKLVT